MNIFGEPDQSRDPAPGSNERGTPPNRGLIVYAMLSLFLLWGWQELAHQLAYETIPYSRFKTELNAGDIESVSVRAEEIRGQRTAEGASRAAQHGGKGSPLFRTIRVEDPELVNELSKNNVSFSGERPGLMTEILVGWILPLALLMGVWMYMARRIGSAGTGLLSFSRSKAKLAAEKELEVGFADVAGCDEAKTELREVVDYLKHPDRYRTLGAKAPKGVLLVGPPGTGKTLMARAVAGESDVPFFSLSGSDFVEMFVGVGAARVRDLFEQAKEQAPCIVFVDELDAIGRQRSVHMAATNDEREQTLNQLLVEMDGFEDNAGVILLAATNRPEVLDRALLRPGRFDRQVLIDSPDIDGREAILKVHTRDKPLAADVALHKIARATPGFSGADLANLVNEAALMAARRRAPEITHADLEEASERVVAGPERRSRRLSEADKRRVAFHEAGHAVASVLGGSSDQVQKISIVPRGRAALGYTLQLPPDEQLLLNRSDLDARLRALLGGRAAEEVVFEEVSTGAHDDLHKATELVRRMITQFGMGESVGLMHATRSSMPAFLEHDEGGVRDCSEQTAFRIDEEVRELLGRSYSDTLELLRRERKSLTRVAEQLIETETMDGEQLKALLDEREGMPHDAAGPADVRGGRCERRPEEQRRESG